MVAYTTLRESEHYTDPGVFELLGHLRPASDGGYIGDLEGHLSNCCSHGVLAGEALRPIGCGQTRLCLRCEAAHGKRLARRNREDFEAAFSFGVEWLRKHDPEHMPKAFALYWVFTLPEEVRNMAVEIPAASEPGSCDGLAETPRPKPSRERLQLDTLARAAYRFTRKNKLQRLGKHAGGVLAPQFWHSSNPDKGVYIHGHLTVAGVSMETTADYEWQTTETSADVAVIGPRPRRSRTLKAAALKRCAPVDPWLELRTSNKHRHRQLPAATLEEGRRNREYLANLWRECYRDEWAKVSAVPLPDCQWNMPQYSYEKVTYDAQGTPHYNRAHFAHETKYMSRGYIGDLGKCLAANRERGLHFRRFDPRTHETIIRELDLSGVAQVLGLLHELKHRPLIRWFGRYHPTNREALKLMGLALGRPEPEIPDDPDEPQESAELVRIVGLTSAGVHVEGVLGARPRTIPWRAVRSTFASDRWGRVKALVDGVRRVLVTGEISLKYPIAVEPAGASASVERTVSGLAPPIRDSLFTIHAPAAAENGSEVKTHLGTCAQPSNLHA